MSDTWTNITKPSVGDPTKKQAFADAVIDNLTFLRSNLVASRDVIPNSSFELDSNSDGVADSWTETTSTGGDISLDTSAGNFVHGGKALKFVHPGGAGNGGGSVKSTNFLDWSEKRPLLLAWAHKCSVAAMRDKVEIEWYDSTQTIISTAVAYDSQANPTSWQEQRGGASPPANTRYAKIKVTGGDSSVSTGGSSWWDDFRVIAAARFDHKAEFTVGGTYTWVCPADVYTVAVTVRGAGGGAGGGDGGGTAGGGGGAGGYAKKIGYSVAPGTAYSLTVGAAGTGGALNNSGTAGGNSDFNAAITANGGSGGVHGGSTGNGGAGGTASGGDVNTTGGAGGNRSGGTGGTGGVHPDVGYRPAGIGVGTTKPGLLNGTGGASGQGAGADGAAGYVLIEF